MLPKNKLAQAMLKKLKVYRGPEHPHEAQEPTPLTQQNFITMSAKSNTTEFQNHLDFIKDEEKKLDFENRTCEVRNWLNYIKIN